MNRAFANGHWEPAVDFDYDLIDSARDNSQHTTRNTRQSQGDRELLILEKFTRAITAIYDARNSKKSALCFLIATGNLSAQGRKIQSAAREFGVTKQDISKCCVAWCEHLGIPPSSYMRCEASKESFRKSNKRKQ